MVIPEHIKQDFPIFRHHPNLVYLDNAATTQKPQVVIDAVSEYYEKYCANIHRGTYALSGKVSERYEAVREQVAQFIGAGGSEEVVFTSGATAGLNGLATSLCKALTVGDVVVLSTLEHHANVLPWLEQATQRGFAIRYLGVNEQGILNEQEIETVIDEKVKIVSVAMVSNVTGQRLPVEAIIQKAKDVGAISVIDACQAVPYQQVDVTRLGCDYLVFSAHKMCGPTGIGVLYGKKHRLETMDPFVFGGGMVASVTKGVCVWRDSPWRFEAGTTDIAAVFGLGATIEYLMSVGRERVAQHCYDIATQAKQALMHIGGVRVIGELKNQKSTIVSFVVDGVHTHDVAAILDDQFGVAVRAGHHCAMPLMHELGLAGGTVRAAFYLYNTSSDVEQLVRGVEKVKTLFLQS